MAFVGTLTLWAASYSACVVYTKTIIYLNVGESGVCLPRRFAAREISTTIIHQIFLLTRDWPKRVT